MGKTKTRLTRRTPPPQPKHLAGKEFLDAYRTMLRARRVDEKAIVLYKQNKCHFQIGCAGHEAIQVAAARALRTSTDYSYPYYRDMAFCAGLGMTNEEFFLNIMNKAADPNSGGRQMPMHYGHKDLNIISQSSPTGTQFLQAVGTALAIRYRKQKGVVYCSAGEGTTAQGAYHEALNWAAREKLPVIFVIQDNKYAISVHISEQLAGQSVSKISRGYEGLEVVEVDGLNYEESVRVMDTAVKRARNGEGPSVIDAQVVRLQSHSISDNQAKYRTHAEMEHDKDRDPLLLMRELILERGFAKEKALIELEEAIEADVDKAAEWADAQPDPAPETALDHIVADLDPGAGIEEKEPTGPETFMVESINHGLDEELARNPEMVIFGEDVAGGKGGVFTVTAGLTAKYGEDRVFNSPLAEDSICGTAFGMAVVGMKPVVEIQFGDYVWTGMMQLRDEFPTVRYRSNGAFSCPAVVRIAVGGYITGGLYHSQNIESFFGHIPGLIVIYPSNATDAKGLIKSAIRARDPVLFLEHKGLYRQVYAKGKEGGKDDLIPIGRARIARHGDAATIVTWGALVQKSLLAAQSIAEKHGREVEVIDLRTMKPLDTQTILQSVRRTGRLLVAYEDNLFLGFGAEIAAIAAEHAFDFLDAPVMRVAGENSHIPHSPVLEQVVLPHTKDIEEALEKLLRY